MSETSEMEILSGAKTESGKESFSEGKFELSEKESMSATEGHENKKRIHDTDDYSYTLDDSKRQKREGSETPETHSPKSTTASISPTATSERGSTTPTYSSNYMTPYYASLTALFPKPGMSALHLNESQKVALDRAKAFARDIQSTLLKSAGRDSSPPRLPSLFLSSNPGLASGIDPRSLSVLSRIYVGSINFELTEQHLRVVFGQFGSIKSVSMSLDPLTGKHKGFCFIEFETPEGASLALESMNGAELGGRQLKVGRPNNYTAATAAGLLPPPKTRIYVSNVNEYVSEDDLLSIFESFGKIIHCALLPDLITRKHKGYGQIINHSSIVQFIEFYDESAATTAVSSMNNFELGGLILHVGKAVIGGPLSEGMKAIEKLPPLPVGVTPPPTLVASPSVSAAAAAAKAQNAAAKIAADLAARGQAAVESVAQEENMSISASQRYAIMQKLARAESSPVVCIRNAVAPSEVDDTLEDEFQEECSNYGKVCKVVVHIDPEEGFEGERGLVKIFVQFEEGADAVKAKEKLDGRWFGGRRINATLFDLKKFQTGDYSN
ncbi:polyadenylate-binding protein 1 [Gigaspora margarita]|uniref:Polyadenylate-binding protein 1 n=1 Tax=Gigaspora margarita TaxID=4874 RepID=A0A8H4EMF9_GIGMA|nr:polyadenylate-binding protein 1 [Gigaspora margarita]